MIDPGAGLVIGIFNLLWILGFMKMDRRVKMLEHKVSILNQENEQKELVEKAELRELVNKATKQKE